MIAEFRSRWSRYVTAVNIDGRNIKVEFEGLAEGGSYHVTTDGRMVRELKRRCETGNDIYLFEEKADPISENIEPEKAQEPEKKEIRVESVTNVTQAREYLRNAGVDYRKLNSPNAIKKQAEQLGVEFPNFK